MATAGRFMAVSSCSSCFRRKTRQTTTSTLSSLVIQQRRHVYCLAVQESSTSTVASETKEKKEVITEKTEDTTAAAKPKAVAKAPVKTLSQLMEEDVIPPLKAILEAQNDISDLDISFVDKKLEGSFLQKGIPYSFWAFFPDGDITGPKGFSLSSYGAGVSTVEPFLVDEKKPTAKLVVFWVEKRLAAQGIIPVWQD